MKKLFFLIGGLLIAGIVSAQSAYIVHTIKDGETLTKLANQYGTTVGDIMRLNKMTTSSKLETGEQVKIPKTDANGVHVVATGETLYSIAHKNKITVAQLRSWNNLSNNIIQEGQTLRLTAPDTTVETNTQAQQIDQAQTANTDVPANDIKQRSDDDVLGNATTVVAAPVSKTINVNPEEGAFAATYQNSTNSAEINTKGSAAIFKTAAGWQDKKYYILMNDVAPGAVVKVQANGKTIYAKVLWNLGNVKENEGLSYRISDAAANVFNLSGDTFDIIVSYYK